MDARAVKSASSSSNVLAEDAPASASSAAPGSGSSVAPNGSDPAEAAAPVVTAATLLESFKAQKEWVKAVAFDGSGAVLASTVKPLEGEVEYVPLYLGLVIGSTCN